MTGPGTTLKATFWMMGAVVSFSTMAVAGREAGFRFDPFEITLFRSVGGLILLAALLSVTRSWHQVRSGALPLHALRNMFHFTGQNLWFHAVTVIPLAQVFALEFTSPIWVVLLSPLLLGERLTVIRLTATSIGFAGILAIARPAPGQIDPGMLAAAIAAVCFALTMIFTRKLTRTESTLGILFWLTVLQTFLGIATVFHDGTATWPVPADLPWLILITICGLTAHYSVTTALSLATAAIVAPIDFVRLPLIALVGLWVYGESLDIFVLAGALLIFTGNYINILTETRGTRQPRT